MTPYAWVKLVHILSAAVLFGAGLGIAFFMLRAHLRSDSKAMLEIARSVVVADALFTAPAVLIQLATGLWLASELGVSPRSLWFALAIGLFVFVGACWLPVVWIQIRVRNILASGGGKQACSGLMRAWSALGALALVAMLSLFYLMVSKLGMDRLL